MSISRRQLYVMGEPIGASATRMEGARRIYGGGGGGSSSSSNQTTTQNTDKRLAVQSGIGVTGDNTKVDPVVNTTTNTTSYSLDGGAVAKSLDTALANNQSALQTVASANAINGDNFNGLLQQAGSLFSGVLDISKTAITAAQDAYSGAGGLVKDAYSGAVKDTAAAQVNTSGGIDNKTIVIGIVAIAAAMAYRK